MAASARLPAVGQPAEPGRERVPVVDRFVGEIIFVVVVGRGGPAVERPGIDRPAVVVGHVDLRGEGAVALATDDGDATVDLDRHA